MKIICSICVIFSIFVASLVWGGPPVSVILDTDIASDVDDVGAVAVLHSLANEGKADILAMMGSAVNPAAYNCLHALNAYFGRSAIPVGMVSGTGIADESKYTAAIAREFGTGSGGKKNSEQQDAIKIYRQVLSQAEDRSVVIITIGYLTNVANLLMSQPDPVSPLTGHELLARKVKKLVTMGGQYPRGREWNFYRDTPATTRVIADWPTPILFCGFESGVKVMTGSRLRETPVGNPLRRSYELYNGLTDRPSWDQLTVMFAIADAVDGEQAEGRLRFTLCRGTNAILPDGGNVWRDTPEGNHFYFRSALTTEELIHKVEKQMLAAVTGVAK